MTQEPAVRRADLSADYGELMVTLAANLPQLPHERYFEWLYRRNPAGAAEVWVATNEDHRIVGMAVAFPRQVYVSNCCAKGYLLGDFCIASEYRSLGLAVRLQQACLKALFASGARFVLDFPSDGMLAVYRRLRIGQQTMIRHAKPLRTDEKIANHGIPGPIAAGVAAIANRMLDLRDRGAERKTACSIALEAGPWGEEFGMASREWAPQIGTSVARTAEYLNWRYREHPQRCYEMLVARENGRLCGYLVQHMESGNYTIDDLMTDSDAVGRDLMLESTTTARAGGAGTLSVSWLASHPRAALLRECGFRERESRPVVVLSGPAQATDAGQDAAGCYICHGDWER